VARYDRAIARLLPAVPRPIVRRFSAHYIAGPSLGDAVRVVRKLNGERKTATIDVLGEEITRAEEARAIADAYKDVFAEVQRQELDSTVSVKLTALGLKLGYDLCRAHLEEVVRHAGERDNFVTIDMEDASTTDETLRLYRELRGEGLDNVGIVLQSSLRRTVADVRDLSELKPHTRICKGIYVEPEELQFRDYEAVRVNFVRTLEALLDAGCYVGVATHDEWLIGETRKLVSERSLGADAYEFQMLLGVREDLADALVSDGHRLRIYVPFGEHWYEYSMRRLQENPAIAGHVASASVSRLLGRRRLRSG
jgi:proline dehydrogenase